MGVKQEHAYLDLQYDQVRVDKPENGIVVNGPVVMGEQAPEVNDRTRI